MLSKRPRYYFDQTAIQEPSAWPRGPDNLHPARQPPHEYLRLHHNLHNIGARAVRNKRDLWTVVTQNTVASNEIIEMKIAVACCNASGMPDMPVFTVATIRTGCESGVHYDKAEALAEDAGYEAPFICFDADEQNAIASAVRELGLLA